MDTTRSPFDDLLAHTRSTLDSIASRLGGDTAAGLSNVMERLQLVPRSEIERLRAEIDALNQRVADLEARIERLAPKDPV